MSNVGDFKEISGTKECPVCGERRRCKMNASGTAVVCFRESAEHVNGFDRIKHTDGVSTYVIPDKTARKKKTPSGDGVNAQASRPNGVTTKSAAKMPPAPKSKTFATPEAAIAVAERQTGGTHAGTWSYHDRDGNEVFRVARLDTPTGKEFRPISRNGAGWLLKAAATPRPLYRLGTLAGAETVWVCEGEKTCDALISIGLVATTSSGGADAPKQSDWTPLAGKLVNLAPDNDAKGAKYGRTVAGILLALDLAATVKIIELPDLPPKGDAVEFLEARDSQEPSDTRTFLERLAADQPELTHDDVDGPAITPVLVCVADIVEEPVYWLWDSRLETGAVNLLGGDPGMSKSVLLTRIIAHVTTGEPWPDATYRTTGTPGHAIILSSEDSAPKAIRPRLRVNGADLNRVSILQAVKEDGRERPFCMQRDLSALRAAIRQHSDTKIIVVDPIDSYATNVDGNSGEDVRAALEPLARLAEQTGVCVLCIKHLNQKTKVQQALYRLSGHTAWTAIARTVHVLAYDPNYPDKSHRLIVPVKINHALRPEAVGYTIRCEGQHPVIEWVAGTIDVDADDVLAPPVGRKPTARNRVAEFVTTALQEAGGSMPAAEIFAAVEQAGIDVSESTITRALKSIGAESMRPSGEKNPAYVWTLPQEVKSP